MPYVQCMQALLKARVVTIKRVIAIDGADILQAQSEMEAVVPLKLGCCLVPCLSES